ncbi:MAG: EamA family transporter [Acidimicrobiia bacterium]
MPVAALTLALSSALLHVAWNYLVKTSKDRLVTAWAVAVGAALISVVVLAIGGLPDSAAMPNIVWSGIIHTAYWTSLARAYVRSDFSVAYPVARGAAPALVALGGFLFLGERIGAIAAVGVLVVSAAVLSTAYVPAAMRSAGWALATGGAIAAYALVDAAGVRTADDALAYTAAVAVSSAVMLTPVVAAVRGARRLAAAAATHPVRLVGAGAMSFAAYAMVLGAALLAPIGLVAAARETSVVLGAAVGAIVLQEGWGMRRMSAATAIVVGVILLGVA